MKGSRDCRHNWNIHSYQIVCPTCLGNGVVFYPDNTGSFSLCVCIVCHGTKYLIKFLSFCTKCGITD